MASKPLRRGRAGVLVIRRGKLAVIHRKRDGLEYWVIPGGGVESGETDAEAAQREAREELGHQVALGPLRVRIAHQLSVLPRAVAIAVSVHHGKWPDAVIDIDER